MKNRILFDLDGTLTEPRQKITKETIKALSSIISAGHEVGIITGSDWDFIEEQLAPYLYSQAFLEKVFYYPCNGTKHYKWLNGKYKLIYKHDMKEHMGRERFEKLILSINNAHKNALFVLMSYDIPISGGNIKYRESMINYSPIGRDYNPEGRKAFAEHPKNKQIRENIAGNIFSLMWSMRKGKFEKTNLSIVLGGQTSLDIYPNGWSKKFVLEKIKDREIWFVGDSTSESGNDYELYKACKTEQAFTTDGPDTTIKIITEILDRIGKIE